VISIVFQVKSEQLIRFSELEVVLRVKMVIFRYNYTLDSNSRTEVEIIELNPVLYSPL